MRADARGIYAGSVPSENKRRADALRREEMARADDLGDYYRIPADSRDLNYNKYFVEGETQISQIDDYTSHNTQRLNVEQIKEVLMQLPLVREVINA